MRPQVLLRLSLVACALAAACGKDSPTEATRVAAVVITTPDDSLLPGQSKTLAGEARDASGTLITRAVAWSTPDTALVSVDVSGRVTGKAPGDARVIASSGRDADTAHIKVLVPAAGVRFAPDSLYVDAGTSAPLTAMAVDAAGNPLPGRALSWSVADATIATVANGAVTGVKSGRTTVTASVEGKSATARVGVYLQLKQIVNGYDHTCALTVAGEAFCWGVNTAGELGLGSSDTEQHLVPERVSGGITFASLTASQGITCGVTTSGSAYCWGANRNGSLGVGDASPRLSPTPVATQLAFDSISTGFDLTCGLARTGDVYCWGLDRSYLLGDSADAGTGTSRLAPTTPITAGGTHFRQLSVSNGHSCAVSTTDFVYCWGNNGNGAFGTGGSTLGLTRRPPTLSFLGRSYRAVVTGINWQLSCALTIAGSTECTGSSSGLQVDLPSRVGAPSGVVDIAAASVGACELTTGGGASCFGLSGAGAFSLVPVGGAPPFVKLMSGGLGPYACALTAAGQGYCWGLSRNGELGDGVVSEDVTVAVRIAPPK